MTKYVIKGVSESGEVYYFDEDTDLEWITGICGEYNESLPPLDDGTYVTYTVETLNEKGE